MFIWLLYLYLLRDRGLLFRRFLGLLFVIASIWVLYIFTVSKSRDGWKAFIQDGVSSLFYFWAAAIFATIFSGYHGYRAMQFKAPTNTENSRASSLNLHQNWCHLNSFLVRKQYITITVKIYNKPLHINIKINITKWLIFKFY